MCPLPQDKGSRGPGGPPLDCLPAPGSGYCAHRQLPPLGLGLVHNSDTLARTQQMGTDEAQLA